MSIRASYGLLNTFSGVQRKYSLRVACILRTFDGDNYDIWVMEVRSLLRSQNWWHFLVEEDPNDPDAFKALSDFQKDRSQVVSLSLIQGNIYYSIFHYIAEAYTPKRAWDILKEVFSEKEEILEDCL